MHQTTPWCPSIRFDAKAGTPTLAAQFFPMAWEERPEFHTRDYDIALAQFNESIECNDRVELISPSGGVVLVAEIDPHVGACMSVQYAYIKPEARHPSNFRVILRYLMEEARSRAFPVVAYSGREREGRFFVQYKRVRCQDG